MTSWDSTVALAYAAEELLFAAQALTTELMPQEQALRVAHSHLHGLLDHEHFLPYDLGRRIEALDASYADRENSGTSDKASATALTGATFEMLGDVRNRLAQCERKRA